MCSRVSNEETGFRDHFSKSLQDESRDIDSGKSQEPVRYLLHVRIALGQT